MQSKTKKEQPEVIGKLFPLREVPMEGVVGGKGLIDCF